jgi:protein O-mannosyl-transferase
VKRGFKKKGDSKNQNRENKFLDEDILSFQISKFQEKALLAILLLIIASLFYKSLNNPFSFVDDSFYIKDNPFIKQLSLKAIYTVFSTFYFSNYHPITTLTYTLEYHFCQLNPFIYHFSNLVIHIANVLLVFWFVKKLTKKYFLSIFIAFFWGIHPMHVESVVWVSERKDLLYTFFYLFSLITYLSFLQKRKFKYILICFLFFAFSCLSKSAAITLPLILIILRYYVTKEKGKFRNYLHVIPFLIISILFGILALVSQGESGTIKDITQVFSITDRVFIFTHTLLFYIINFFFPYDLSIFHYYPLKTQGFFHIGVYASLIIIIAILYFLLFKTGKLKNQLFFGAFFFLFTILLTLQIIPVGTSYVADRYSYLPYLGFLFMIGYLFIYLKSRFKIMKSAVPFFILIWGIGFSTLAYSRVILWSDNIKLIKDMIKKHPSSYEAYQLMGNVYKNEGLYAEALSNYNKSISLYPYDEEVYNNRGCVYFILQNDEAAEKDYSIAIKLKPDFYLAYLNRGDIYNQTGKFQSAVSDYTNAIKIYPDSSQCFHNRGDAYFNLKDYILAKIDYSKAIQIDSDDYISYCNRGLANASLTDYKNALSDYNKSISLFPFAQAYFNRGLLFLFQLNSPDSACADFAKARDLGNQNASELILKYCK